MKLSKLKNIIKEEIQKLKSPQPLSEFSINENMKIKFPLQEQNNSNLHKFEFCSIPGYEGSFFVCADGGTVNCIPGDADFSNLYDNSQTFYEAVGSPSPGDLIKFDYIMQAGTAYACFRYVGLEPYTSNGLAVSLYLVNNYPPENMGSSSCESCLLVNHSCNVCNGCVEDPNGPFTSLLDCQESGCSEDLESFALSLGISNNVSGMTAVEQYCTKCASNSWSPPYNEKCKCCGAEQYIDGPVKPYADGMPTLPRKDIAPTQINRMQKLANIKPGNEKI